MKISEVEYAQATQHVSQRARTAFLTSDQFHSLPGWSVHIAPLGGLFPFLTVPIFTVSPGVRALPAEILK